MPTADAAIDAYQNALDHFVTGVAATQDPVVSAFHAVRRMAYRSGPDRTALTALRTGQGACTAKHVILRDVLRRLGEAADVEIVEGDFASGIPPHPSMTEALRSRLAGGPVVDFHCRVIWTPRGGSARVLDATWPDGLAAYGFAVNADWKGRGDTRSAMENPMARGRPDDVAGEKERLLSGLPDDVAEDRRRFLRLLSEWLADLG